MKSLSRQRGASMFGVLFVIVVLCFVAFAATRAVPMYVEYYKVQMAMEKLRNQPESKTESSTELKRRLFRWMHLDDIKSVTPKDIYVEREPGWLVMRVAYERREKFAGPYDLVGDFDYSVKIGRDN